MLITLYRPRNKEELFNLRHASARNVIERIFGVLKRKFRILQIAPEYNMSLQVRIPLALAALHNFIREYEPEDDEGEDGDDVIHNPQPVGGTVEGDDDEAEGNDGTDQRDERRDQIARDMWTQYVEEHARRGIPFPV